MIKTWRTGKRTQQQKFLGKYSVSQYYWFSSMPFGIICIYAPIGKQINPSTIQTTIEIGIDDLPYMANTMLP